MAPAIIARTRWLEQARPKQIIPGGDWFICLILAGRGFGKTRSFAEDAWWYAVENPEARIAVVAPTAGDLRRTCFEGESGIAGVVPPEVLRGGSLETAYNRSLFELNFANGSKIQGYSSDAYERLRGPNFHRAYCDELAAWPRTEAWDMLMMTLRLGTDPRCIIATTPKPTPLVRKIADPSRTDVRLVRGSTFDNSANLAPQFLEQIRRRYEGTRLGRQELEAEILGDLPGALWTRDMVEAARVAVAPDMQRVVVGVDPSGKDADSEGGDEQGIIVCGLGVDGLGYVLADASCRELPGEWGRRVIGAYQGWGADRIVAETNFGGGMVRHTIQTAMKNAPVRVMTASRGKVARAEPVSALFEQGRVKLVGTFPMLEDQMCSMKPSGYEGGGSPDRLDAMVWAMSDLMLGGFEPRIVAPVQVGGGPAGFSFPMPG
jgi:phage terminase large subunit-like protein